MRRLLLLVTLSLFPSAALLAQTCSTSWINPSGGSWSTAANWSSGLPNSSSDVCINLSGTYTVTLTGNVTINSLSLGNASGEDVQTLELGGSLTLGAASTVHPTGHFEWLSGSIQGAGALASDGTLRISGPSLKDVRNVVTNRATAEIAGPVRLIQGAQFVNAETGLLTFTGDDDVTQFNNATLVNHGTLVKNGSADETAISSQFTNTGRVEIITGTLRLSHTITLNGGTYTASEDAALLFNANTHVTGTLSGAPAGTVAFVNGTFYAVGAEARLDFGGAGVQWHAGTFRSTSDGTWFNDGLFYVRGSSSKDLYDTFTNAATVRLESGFRLIGGAQFVNADGARLEMIGSLDVTQFNNSVLVNDGLLLKQGEGTVAISAQFANTGTVDVQEGTLRLQGSRTTLTGGTYAVAEQATLAFRSNTYATGTLSGAPAGALVMEGNTFYAEGTEAVLDLAGTGFRWLAGTFRSNGGMWRNDGTLTLATAAVKDLYDTFTNTGSATLNGPLRLVAGIAGARFVNAEGGQFEVEGVQTISQFNAASFVNAGLLTISGDTLTVNTGFQHRATGTLAGDGLLALTSSPTHGTIAPGDLTWARAFSMDSSSARLDVAIGGTAAGTDYGRLRVLNTAQLQGTLRVNLTSGFVPQEGDAFSVLTASSITGLFDRLEGLTDSGGNLSLYPVISDTAVTLLARAGVPTASGTLALTPSSTVNGNLTTIVLTGTGFAPDATVRLQCTECSDPEQFGTIPGRIRQMTPTMTVVQFDLRDPFVAGLYDLVLEDPRGGRVSAELVIGVGTGNLAVRIFAEGPDASERGPTPGVITVELSAPQMQSLVIPFTLGGTAFRFQDYVLSEQGTAVTIPAGKTRATLTVLPLPDLVADDGETVLITLEPSNQYTLSSAATAQITIADGPAPTEFTLYSSSPNRAGNEGTVIFNITGQAIVEGATARLSGAGVNLTASVANVSDGGTFMNAMFDLTGVAAGTVLDLTVTSGDGKTETLAGAVTVEELVKPEISVQLVGPNTFRTFLPPQRYQVMVTNRGNVDVMAVPVSIAVSKAGNGYLAPDFDVTFLDPAVLGNAPEGFPGWDESSLIEDRGDGRLIMSVLVPAVRAGETVTLTVLARGYRIKAWTSPSARPLVTERPRLVSIGRRASLRTADVSTANMWTGLDAEALAVQVAEAANSDALRNCILTGIGSILGATPLGCAAEVTRSVAGFVGAMAGIASTPNAGARDGAVATVSMVGAMAAVIAQCAFQSSPWGLGIGITVGVISTANACADLFSEPDGNGQDNDDISAIDPNDKLGPSGAGLDRFTAGLDAAGYQIRFENDTTATAPAVLVSVTDQLDVDKFDLSTFTLGTIVFSETSVTPPPGLRNWTTTVELPGEDRFFVRIVAGLNEQTGVATWQLMAVDPQTGEFPSDATAGFLPPNLNAPEGEGSLFFTIKPKPDLPSGTQLCNEASIIFDVNEPIVTPPWCNTLDFVDPVSQMEALAEVQPDTSFDVSWQGQDATSGVAEYLVYVSTNSGPFELWQMTNGTSATFNGAPDSTYAFYVVARDGAGNLEDKPEVAETTTRVDLTAVSVEGDALPTEFALNGNAPNPFGAHTRIRYALPEASPVRLEVFDMLGRRVALLVDEVKPAGYHMAEWDAARDLASGLYFIRLHAGRYVEVREATLVR